MLLKRRFLLDSRGSLAILGPAFLVYVFAAVTTANDLEQGSGAPFALIWYGIFLLGIGYFASSNVISELSTAEGRQAYLTLPASDTEKWLSAWLFSGPIFLIVFTLLYGLVTVLVNALLGIWAAPKLAFDPFGDGALHLMQIYLLGINPVALLGGIVFNRFAFAKTAGIAAAVSVAFGLLTMLTVRIIYNDHFTGFFTPVGDGPNVHVDNPFEASGIGSAWVTIAVATTLLLAASYFKVQEKEV